MLMQKQFFCITALCDFLEHLSREEAPTESKIDFCSAGAIQTNGTKWALIPGGRNTCAAECTAVGVAQSTGSPTGTSLMTRVASVRVCVSSSITTLQRRDGPWSKHEGTAEFTVFCISVFSVFHWGNEHRMLAVSHQQRVVPLCHNPCLTLVYPSPIFFPHFSLHSIFVRCFYVVWNVCRIFLSWNVENS